MPNWKIKVWLEADFSNLDLQYITKTLSLGKYAFASDYARIYLIYKYGGVYLDVDCVLIKSFEELIEDVSLFFAFESETHLASGLGFGAVPGNKYLREILDYYNSQIEMLNKNYEFNSAPINETNIIKKYGLVYNGNIWSTDDLTVFPVDYFSPLNYNTGKLNITINTVSIHYFTSSWTSKTARYLNKLRWSIIEIFGVCIGLKIYKILEILFNALEVLHRKLKS